LAKIAQEAKAAGTKAKTYDLCKVSVANTNLFCSGNVGIPRSAMPQLKGVPTAGSLADSLPKDSRGEVDLSQAFRDSLTAGGNMIIDTNEFASHLRASQTEMDGAKVGGMMEAIAAGKIAPSPIFVSDDNYIVDGHHRWAANVGVGLGDKKEMSMPIARVNMKILPLLSAANSFAEKMGIPQSAVGKAFFAVLDVKMWLDEIEDEGDDAEEEKAGTGQTNNPQGYNQHSHRGRGRRKSVTHAHAAAKPKHVHANLGPAHNWANTGPGGTTVDLGAKSLTDQDE
jgi:hypothetical protein